MNDSIPIIEGRGQKKKKPTMERRFSQFLLLIENVIYVMYIINKLISKMHLLGIFPQKGILILCVFSMCTSDDYIIR